METATFRGRRESRNTERTGDAAPPPMTFSGRTVSREMGQVRLGGSGRPLAITTRNGDSTPGDDGAVERLQPRVVLEPQPRSPFGRKLETSVNASLASAGGPERRAQPLKSAMAPPPERVHTTHHPTHRTPVAVALRRVDAQLEDTAGPNGTTRKRLAPSDAAKTSDRKIVTRATKVAKRVVERDAMRPVDERSIPEQRITSPTARDLKPEQIALFTRKPDEYEPEVHPFHTHERLAHLAREDHTVEAEAFNETDASRSGWRAVDDSIDHIYEDPSIDVVQQHLLLHANIRSGEKRKAVERGRLQAAAAEVQKQRDGQNVKLIEFQNRRERILRMSEDIRARNKVFRQGASVTTNRITSGNKKKEQAPIQPTRKPPVPRLSQLGGKPRVAKSSKKGNVNGDQAGSDQANDGADGASRPSADAATADETSDADDRNETKSDSRASETILRKSDGPKKTERPAAGTRAPKKRKQNTTAAAVHQQTLRRAPPMDEKVQRREVAREYMQIQKQTRQLMQAKLTQQRQLEEERRRLELQRLEQTRLLELEESRKRRIRQKQRERAAERKRAEQERDNPQNRGSRSSRSVSPAQRGGEDYTSYDTAEFKGTENQNFRGNHPVQNQSSKRGFRWPDSDHDSSRGSSPRSVQQSVDHDKDAHVTRNDDPKLQKLRALEEQTKLLAQKLQSLSKGSVTNERDKRSQTLSSPRVDDEEMESGRGSENGDSEDSENSEGSEDSVDSVDSEHRVSDTEQHLNDQHSATRVDHEDFVHFDGGFSRSLDPDHTIDFSSIGVKNIHVVWPRDDHSDNEIPGEPSARFEVLSSSSSSSRSSRQVDDNDTRKNDQLFEAPSPKLWEESVDAYAQRLFDRSVRTHSTISNERPQTTIHVSEQHVKGTSHISSSSWLRHKISPPKRKQPTSSDAELLRLIRESDDNLSVIDREAKRRFRLQQDRLRLRQQDQERHEQVRLKERLQPTRELSRPHTDAPQATQEAERDFRDSTSEPLGYSINGDIPGFQKLDQILEAVRTETDTIQTDAVPSTALAETPGEQANPPATTVAFWNSQLQSVPTGRSDDGHPKARVEVDRSDIHAQRERRLELEDEDDDFDRPRILSPQTLAKHLLAAVEYHEVIHDAHLQLSLMEKEQALEQVQQDTIALAQAFKDELEGNLVAQQLEDEHAALEGEFDRSLKQVVEKLETVREAEQHQSELVRRQLEEEARAAKRRESAVQTEPLQHVDAATSARLRVEVASTTDAERHDTAVQHTIDDVVPTLPTQEHSEKDEHVSVDDYEEETFDRASLSSPLKPSQVADERPGQIVTVEVYDDSLVEEPEELQRGEHVSRHELYESRGGFESEGDAEIEEEDQSAGVRSESIKHDAQSMEDDDELMSEASNIERKSQSVSVAYDDDDFEEDPSLARLELKTESRNVQVASTDGIFESEEDVSLASIPHSESASVGYEEDDFEHDVPVSRERETFKPDSGRGRIKEDVTDETSEAAVSDDYVNEEEDDEEDSKSISDDASFKDPQSLDRIASRQTAGDSPDRSPTNPAHHATIPERVPMTNISNLPSVPPVTFTVTTPLVGRTASVDPEIARSYIVQLENRKHSEQALLEIRLRALESKLQQDLQCVVEEVKQNERAAGSIRDERKLNELELQRDALQMTYLSEKANIESQKSACVSRYYQDLLALRSLGTTTSMSPILGSVGTHTAPLVPTKAISAMPIQPSAPANAKQVDESESDAYEEDDFATSAVHSDAYVKEIQDQVDAQDIKSESSSHAEVDDEQNEIPSDPSVEGDEESDDAVSSEPENDTADPGYDDEDFASVSESAHVEERDEDEEEGSIESTPLVVEEPAAVADTPSDEVSAVYEDEFAAASEDVAIQEASTGVIEADIEADEANDVAASAEKQEPDETSELYGEDEFASVSESALNAAPAAVSEDDLDNGAETITDEIDKPIDTPESDASDDVYEDEFASVSETAGAPEVHDSVSDENIQEDNVHAERAPEEPEDDMSTHSRSKSDDNYADDGFDESEAPSERIGEAMHATQAAGMNEADNDEEAGEQYYSDEDFEQSEVRSSASSGIPDRGIDDANIVEPLATGGDEAVEHTTDVAMPSNDGIAAYELPTVKSLSANELSVADITQASHLDISAMPAPLAESISVSHQEEDLTTASMEEQLKRIDDLKRQIDLRKEAFAAVQKKMRVEKKKEYLREAETQLWAEMENLESQLEADERILELTCQRGRLESMELEAKHYTLQQRGKDHPELLADYDYSEPVEPVKPAVVKQDNEAQVRLADQPAVNASSRVVVTHTADHWEQDLLLAFDHVELAERPVTTIATNTDTTRNCGEDLPAPEIPAHVLQTSLVSSDVTGGLAAAKVPTQMMVSEELLHPASDVPAIKKSLEAEHEPTETAPDLLAGYDHIEAIEKVEVVLDLLRGYDHIELAEPCIASMAVECIADQVSATYDSIPVQEEDRVRDELVLGDQDSVNSEDAIVAESLTDEEDEAGLKVESAVLEEETAPWSDTPEERGDTPETAIPTELEQMSLALESAPFEEDSSLDSQRVEEDADRTSLTEEYEEDFDKTNTAPVGDNSGEEAPGSGDEEERVQRATEDLFRSLMRGAVADMRSTELQKAGRRNLPAANQAGTDVSRHILKHDTSHTDQCLGVERDEDRIDVSSGTRESEEELPSATIDTAEFDVVHHGSDEQGPHADDEDLSDHVTEQPAVVEQHDAIVERIFASLMAAAIQDGVQVGQKKPRAAQDPRTDRQAELERAQRSQTVPNKSVRVAPLHPSQKIESEILSRLRIDADQVRLPPFHECVLNQRGTSNARAIYDAVFDVASSVHHVLRADALFLNERGDQKKCQLLIDRVKREMEESIWSIQERARDELDRLGRRMLEEEQGELDQDDLRLLLAQQRGGTSSALVSRFHAVALHTQLTPPPSSVGAGITPRLRRRGSSSSSLQASHPGLASQILQGEEARLADRITERVMRDLVRSETAALRRAAIERC